MPAPQTINLAKLQKEAGELGITLDRDDDGTFWGRVEASKMELGGYESASAALEDLKAVVTLDGATDLFSYDNDPDDETMYRVIYLPDGMVFAHSALAVALSDGLAHHTEQSRPAQPQAPKRRGMRKPGNGPQTIEHEPTPTVEETLPTAPELPKVDVGAKFHELDAKKEDIQKNLIRSEDPGLRTPPMISPEQKIATALLAIAHNITEVARQLGGEEALPYGSAFEDPEDAKPKSARNRKGAN